MTKLVLASSSPRRSEILKNVGVDFDVISSSFQEILQPNQKPIEAAMSFAFGKAMEVADTLKDECLVIGADTIVVLQDKILGKPKDAQDAFQMLNSMQGREHHVITGLCIIQTPTMEKKVDYEITKVWMSSLDKDVINKYIATGESFDKAGAYGIQGYGSLLVTKIEGCYFNVVGLPIYKLSTMLKGFNYDIL
jgi:septum formation protein